MINLIDAVNVLQLENLIHVSSTVAAGHYFDHTGTKESDERPTLMGSSFYAHFESLKTAFWSDKPTARLM